MATSRREHPHLHRDQPTSAPGPAHICIPPARAPMHRSCGPVCAKVAACTSGQLVPLLLSKLWRSDVQATRAHAPSAARSLARSRTSARWSLRRHARSPAPPQTLSRAHAPPRPPHAHDRRDATRRAHTRARRRLRSLAARRVRRAARGLIVISGFLSMLFSRSFTMFVVMTTDGWSESIVFPCAQVGRRGLPCSERDWSYGLLLTRLFVLLPRLFVLLPRFFVLLPRFFVLLPR
jgi:hypothetical protein